MLFANILDRTQRHLERRRRYNRLAAEIISLSPREVSDLSADRGQMLRDLHREIYG